MHKIILVIVLFITGCSATPKPTGNSENSVTIMSYNLENLFDTMPDKDREDFTFISKSYKGNPAHRLNCGKLDTSASRKQECLETDWSEAVLDLKMSRLAKVILGVNGGRGPDILITGETENIRVLTILNEKHLKPAGYQSVALVEGPDPRGIDVGMLSRYPMVGAPKLNLIKWEPKTDDDKVWMARSRGILEVTFKLPTGELLTVMGVHFPSQANPTYWREQAIATLNEIKTKLPKDRLTIVGGDFNISAEEDARTNLFRERIANEWLVSHYIGCGNCEGTHNYRGSWSFLDALLFSPNMGPTGGAPWQIDPKSIDVVKNSRYQTNIFNSPARFNESSPVGVSDHYPIMATIIRR